MSSATNPASSGTPVSTASGIPLDLVQEHRQQADAAMPSPPQTAPNSPSESGGESCDADDEMSPSSGSPSSLNSPCSYSGSTCVASDHSDATLGEDEPWALHPVGRLTSSESEYTSGTWSSSSSGSSLLSSERNNEEGGYATTTSSSSSSSSGEEQNQHHNPNNPPSGPGPVEGMPPSA